MLRHEAGLTNYRYQWASNLSNIDGQVRWSSAYHFSGLYKNFGTYFIAPWEISELEVRTSEKTQGLIDS